MDLKNQEAATSSPRIARRRARIRERILTTAARLFAAHGIDNITLTDITNEADVSRGNLYSHFAGKEGLIHAICQPAMAYGRERMHLLVGLPPDEAVERMLRIHAEIWRKFPGASSIIYQLQSTSAGKYGLEHKHEEGQGHNMEAIFQQAAKMNLLRVEPALGIMILDTVVVPLLELAQEATDPDEFFVESMRRLLLKE